MKNWILRWLGLAPKNTGLESPFATSVPRHGSGLIEGATHRNFFEIITAVNGKIVVYNRHFSNPSGPDKNDMEIYLVPDGEDLMATVTTAIVSARLK
jgi:hypothetical protein